MKGTMSSFSCRENHAVTVTWAFLRLGTLSSVVPQFIALLTRCMARMADMICCCNEIMDSALKEIVCMSFKQLAAIHSQRTSFRTDER